jgi:copper chaperone
MKHDIAIDGMSCGHCVAAVKGALETVPGVRKVEVAVGRATLEADDTVTRAALTKAIEDEGFRVPS